MPKRKYKFKLENIECSVCDIGDLQPLMELLVRAAHWERFQGHLVKVQEYHTIRKNIAQQVKDQIKE